MKRIIALILTFCLISAYLFVPVLANETVIYTTADANYFEEGKWGTSGKAELQGFSGEPARYLSYKGSAKWIPQLKHGKYKVSVYKTVHPASLNNQIFKIVHHSKTDYAVVDFVSGEKGWVELGTYDFWGDGSDCVGVERENGLDATRSHRMYAISFELVEEIKEPVPTVKPQTEPGTEPDVELYYDEVKKSTVTPPEKVGDAMLIPASDPVYFRATGEWSTSDRVKGHEGGSMYCSSKGGKFTYIPYMPAGTYKVEFFKPVHENSLKNQLIEINHQGKTDSVSLDLTSGSPEWVTLGTYDFWGNGDDSISSVNSEGNGIVAIRTSAVRFTLLKLSDTPAPKGKADPSSNNDFSMDVPAMEEALTDDVSVMIDSILQHYDQPATIIDGRTLVPLRGIFEAFGASVYWDDSTKTVTAIQDETTIVLQIGNKTATKNGENIALDVPAQIINSRTLVPARFVSEALGATVDWDADKRLVLIQTGEKGPDNIFIPSKAFQDNLGSWYIDSQELDTLMDCNLKGKSDETGISEPAKCYIDIKEEGEYLVFVHAKDYASNQPGTRFFEMTLNGVRCPKAFGQHGKDGYAWEKIGPVNLKQGKLEIALIDTSTFYARCDGIYITKNLKLKNPPSDQDSIRKVAKVMISNYSSDINYPAWAENKNTTPIATNTIKSDSVTLDFYTINTPVGNTIQKRMTVNGKVTSDRENNIAALLFYAKDAAYKESIGQFPSYEITLNNGETYKTTDIYNLGNAGWLIPDRIEAVDEKTVRLYAQNSYADAVFTVSVKDGETEPVVKFTLTPKLEGSFSAVLISGDESEHISYAFLPYRYNSSLLPAENNIISEPFATIPMSLKTAKNAAGEIITSGIAVEPYDVPLRWPKANNAEYGLTLKGSNSGARPALIAPLYSSENSKMKPGDSYSISYRLIETHGDWYPIYEHFALDIYKITDYRSNYNSTLTDAIFNTTTLAADDYAGWDSNQMGYSNIEAENLVTQSNPLVFMSTYLLTEDKDFLERRTIPTLAYTLTRQGFHYNNGDIEGKAVYGGVYPIGKVCESYGNTVFGGAYVMSQKLIPQFKEHGIGKGLLSIDQYGVAPTYLNYLWLYNYTGEKDYLEKAKIQADNFIVNEIDGIRNTPTDGDMFVAISYYPQFFGLIDLYEVTGEQKYIDAAVRGAHHLLPTVWIYPNTNNGENYTISADAIRENHFGQGHTSWYLKERYRPGYPEKLETLKDQTLPFTVVSRAGLSMEQNLTYVMHDSGNMIMANWAPDLLRLAEYSGEKIFETYARNAIVGRHSTYSGYYYNNYFAYQMDQNYPYEGPDITGLYWHHIQPFLAMLQDFLFTQAWNWSDQKIDFPSVRNTGYAYFNNRMYGGQPGTFYDETDMWLWLKEGTVKTDNVQLDWFGARKDGVAAFAFMNESEQTQNAVVTFGDVLEGFTGEAVLYDAKGNTSSAVVTNGKLEITVPGRTLVSVKIKSESVKAPEYTSVVLNTSASGKQTALPKDGETDTGHILQMSGDEYFGYVYVTESLNELDEVILHYKAGNGEWITAESDTYAPFEFIVRIDDTTAPFTYYVEKIKDGKKVTSSQKTLVPLGTK